MTEQELYKAAVDKWGPNTQLDLAMEEMSELIVALCHHKRGRPNNVEEEIADVEILLAQLRLMFNGGVIDSWKAAKLTRLEGLLR